MQEIDNEIFGELPDYNYYMKENAKMLDTAVRLRPQEPV